VVFPEAGAQRVRPEPRGPGADEGAIRRAASLRRVSTSWIRPRAGTMAERIPPCGV